MKRFLLVCCVLAFCLDQLYAQKTPTVSGLIISQKTTQPLAGVTIAIKDGKAKAVSDSTGRFSIPVNSLINDVLIFSYVGFESQEIKINKRSFINIVLAEKARALDEVIVVGYGRQKKINLTGAVDNVTLSDVDDRVLTNASQILQGKVPGLTIVQNSGQPGQDAAQIRIRGVSSIENNNDPLVIIDGVQGELTDVNPNDIESMSILKDAAAASIYGNRAAAGVIIITTKTGASTFGVNYIGTVSMQQPTALPKSVNAATYARLYNEAAKSSGSTIGFTDEQIAKYDQGTDPEYMGTNWYDKYVTNAFMHNHYLGLKGGEPNKYRYSLSGGYLDQDGILVGTGSRKVNYLANVTGFLYNRKLQLNAVLSGYDANDRELFDPTPSVLQQVGNNRPVAYFKSSEGLYSYPARYLGAKELGAGITRGRNNFKYQLGVQVQPLKWITLNVNYANNTYNSDYLRYVPNYSTAAGIQDGEGTKQQSEINIQTQKSTLKTFNSTLQLQKSWKQHNFSLLGGFEAIEYTINSTNVSGSKLSSNQPVLAYADPSTIVVKPATIAERASLSVFSRFNYNYDEKYLFEANLRRDGSSRFLKGNQWGNFPSFSAGWVISKEKFMEGNRIFNLLKLRGSWGRLGNEGIQTFYAASDVLASGNNYSFGGIVVPGTATALLANRNTTWETTEQTNIGLDAGIMNRWNITANYFYKKTYDVLARVTVPLSLGTSANNPYQNIGTVENKGVELGIQYNNDPKHAFTYTVNVNLTWLKNRVVDLGKLEYIFHNDLITGYAPPSGIIRSAVGQPFGSYYGLIAEGIYQLSDFTWQNNSDPNIPYYDRQFVLNSKLPDPSGVMSKPVPGDIKFKDRDGNGMITDDDKTFIGKSQPAYVYSLGFNARYKNFELNLLAQGVLEADSYLMGAMVSPFWNLSGNLSKDMANSRWTPENPSSKYQRLYIDRNRNNIISSYYIQNAAYLRVKNLMLGYSLPPKMLAPYKIKTLKVFATVENLLTFSGFDNGFDPEKSFNRITSDFYPQVRTYAFGINVGL